MGINCAIPLHKCCEVRPSRLKRVVRRLIALLPHPQFSKCYGFEAMTEALPPLHRCLFMSGGMYTLHLLHHQWLVELKGMCTYSPGCALTPCY